jgi:hypothetical protein
MKEQVIERDREIARLKHGKAGGRIAVQSQARQCRRHRRPLSATSVRTRPRIWLTGILARLKKSQKPAG